jgi:hypothetical protein
VIVSEQKKGITRREFFSTGVKGAGLVGLGGAIGLTAGRLSTDKVGKRPATAVKPSYDLEEFSTIDPALIRYQGAGEIRMKAQHLRAIAAGPDDCIYVAADKFVQVFDRDAVLLSELRLNDSPRCLTVTEDGTIYVGMTDCVEVYDSRVAESEEGIRSKGVRKASWDRIGQNAVLTSIAVSENHVFVADAGNRVVLRYDASGKLVRRIGDRDESRNIPGFVVPSPYFDMAVSPDGLLRVANPGEHRVEAYTFDGDFELSWGNTSMQIDGFCGCCNPVNFAMLPDGRFVTCEKGLPRVKIYDANGVFESVVAGPKLFAANARTCILDDYLSCQIGGLDVAADSQGRILVMDPVEKVVRIFTQTESA